MMSRSPVAPSEPSDLLAAAFAAGREAGLAGVPLDRTRRAWCERQVWHAYRDGYAIGMIEAPSPAAIQEPVASQRFGRLRLWLGWYRRAVPLSGADGTYGIGERVRRVA